MTAGRSRRARLARALLLGVAIASSCAVARAQDVLNALREEVLMIRKPGLFSLEVETTLYRPPGDGPHPLLIINHGKASGDPRFQARARYTIVAREFVQRGYAVAIPMRQGFSKSSGAYIGGGCNVGSNGLVQADDVRLVLDALAARTDIDAQRVVAIGQSHGGLTTLALGTLKLPNLVGLINFAGGLRNDNCTAWEQTLARAIGGYARDTTVPSLWFYGDNDSYFAPRVWQDIHARYVEGGGRAKLVAFGTFGSDAHQLFGARAGLPIWLPEVERFFRELSLPFDKRHAITLVEHDAPVPAGSGFASIDDVQAVPYLSAASRERYRAYLSANPPKAFAVAANGAWASRGDSATAMRDALERCQTHGKDQPCKLYAVDDTVVWSKP